MSRISNKDILRNAYYQPKNPGSFGGLNRLKQSTNISNSEVRDFLEEQETYTKHKSIKHKFPRRKITVPCIDYLWQADLVFVTKFYMKNSGVRYLLTVIDVLSRYAFVRPLRNKQSSTVTEAFQSILDESGRKPRFMETDRGTEFGSFFKKFIATRDIKMYHNFSPLKAAMVERFNRTLMMRIYKYFTFTNQKKYVHELQNFVSSYNSSIHRIIKCAPKDVTVYNQIDAWMNTYYNPKEETKKPKYSEGMFVRIKADKKTFEKGFTKTFSNEIYRIRKVVASKPITYLLSNSTNDDIEGVFYNEELSRFKIS